MSTTKAWIGRHQLITFFVVTYGLMFGVTFAYLSGLPLPYPLVWFLGIFSPTLTALLISALCGGWPAVKALLLGFTRCKVGARWYLAALFLVLFPLAIALVYSTLGNPVQGLAPGVTASVLLGQFVFTLFSGPLAEEAGWRGFALPALADPLWRAGLQPDLGRPVGWLAHPALRPGRRRRARHSVSIFLGILVVLATLFTWLYNNTGGSLIITVLAHFSFNLCGAFITGTLGLMPMNIFFMIAGPGLGVVFVLVILFFGPRYLSLRPAADLPFAVRPRTRPAIVAPLG